VSRNKRVSEAIWPARRSSAAGSWDVPAGRTGPRAGAELCARV